MSDNPDIDFIVHTVPSSLLAAYLNHCEVASDDDYNVKVTRPALWGFVSMFHEEAHEQDRRSAWNRYIVRVVWMRP